VYRLSSNISTGNNLEFCLGKKKLGYSDGKTIQSQQKMESGGERERLLAV